MSSTIPRSTDLGIVINSPILNLSSTLSNIPPITFSTVDRNANTKDAEPKPPTAKMLPSANPNSIDIASKQKPPINNHITRLESSLTVASRTGSRWTLLKMFFLTNRLIAQSLILVIYMPYINERPTVQIRRGISPLTWKLYPNPCNKIVAISNK